jgi:hypothetical protein
MNRCYLVLCVLLAVGVSAQANYVINGDFQTIIKPGEPTIAATIADGEYFSIGNKKMQGGATAYYADGTSGSGIELPGWTVAAGSNNNADGMQAGTWGGPDGAGDIAFLCFGTWGGPTVIVSAAPLSVPAGALELSADVFHTARPVVLDLLVDGVVITPDTASSPAGVDLGWVEFTRTYSSVPAGNLTIRVGTTPAPFTGNRASIDNVTLVPEPVTMAFLGLGGLLIRRRRK